MKLADPRPSLCSACGNAGDQNTRFIDCEAVREGPVVYDKDTGQIAVDPTGAQITLEDIYLCESCVNDAAEKLAYVPRLHRTHLAEIRRLRAIEQRLDDENKRLRSLVANPVEEVVA